MQSQALSRLLGSSKAIVALPMIVGAFLAFQFNKITWDQAENFVKWVFGMWIGGQSLEDAAKHYGASKGSALGDSVAETVENAVRSSMRPPAMPSKGGK
jgi:hypothetical protein